MVLAESLTLSGFCLRGEVFPGGIHGCPGRREPWADVAVGSDTQPFLGTEKRVLRKCGEWKERLWNWERSLAMAHDPGRTTPSKWHCSQLSL